jgi:hypothetical protein
MAVHSSVRLEVPIEAINITPVNPLISKCQIKVCYVGEEPNRNKSIITKDVARSMANSLPGSPIVGYFNEQKGDFEEHNRMIDVSNGKFEIKDTTRPYGFVDLNAKVWFQKFLDDGIDEHEYLMTEGWLWTSQYPECQRIVNRGNNQSMELDEKTLDATWSKNENGEPQFFIINEAIISKLCILGDDCEPCFEGANITAPTIQFSFDEGFKNQLFSMMEELKEYLVSEGGTNVYTTYAVDIGDGLWTALYTYIEETFPDSQNMYCSIYRIEGVFEENGTKFAVLQNRKDMKYYKLVFSYNDEGFSPTGTLVEVTKTYTPVSEPQFALADVEAFETEYASNKKEKNEDKTGEEDDKNSDNTSEGSEDGDNTNTEDDDDEKKKKDKKFAKEEDGEETCPKCGKPLSECTCEKDDDKKKNYSLDEIPEYVELQTKYAALETNYNSLKSEKDALSTQVESLTQFKNQVERKDKEDMIAKFYMLSDEDKADVVANIDTYSLDKIEEKLSVICVRNKVNLSLDDDTKEPAGPTVFNLNDGDDGATPAWVKRALSVAKTLQ